MFENTPRPGAPLRNRTVDLLLTICNSLGSPPGQHFLQAEGKRWPGPSRGLRYLRSLRPSRRLRRSSWCGSLPSERRRPAPATPGMPPRPGPWRCMPLARPRRRSKHGQTIFAIPPAQGLKARLSRRFPIAGKFEPLPLSLPRMKVTAAAQESCRAEDHTAAHAGHRVRDLVARARPAAPARPDLPK